jgi:class 3 adenylate cyclase
MDTTRGVLFVDISESTELYRNRGDESGHRVLRRCLGILRRVVEACDGEVNRQIGDELLCLFPDPGATARGAVEQQRAVQAAKRDGRIPDELNVRIGLHHGPVGIDGKMLFGDTVHTAKRMVDLAKPQQILTSGTTAQALTVRDALVTRHLGARRIKGHSESIDVFEIVWDLVAATNMDPVSIHRHGAGEEQLTLEYRDLKAVVDPGRPRLKIGRDGQCDLVIDEPQVSRFHARIEHSRSGFRLIDMSTNGTQVLEQGGRSRVLHRDGCRLSGKGQLILGRSPSGEGSESENSPNPIEYRCAPLGAPDSDDNAVG